MDDLISELGAGETPCVRVYNKCDAFSGELPHGENVVCLSAKTGEGAAALLQTLSRILESGKKRAQLLIPYTDNAAFEALRRDGAIETSDYREDGIFVEAVVRPELWPRVREYEKKD